MSTSKLSRKLLQTSLGTLKAVTFKKFIDLIDKKSVNPYGKDFVTFVVPGDIYGQFYDECLYSFQEEPTQRVVPLMKVGNRVKDVFLRFELLNQAKLMDLSNKGLEKELYYAVENYGHKNGVPTHLVRVCNRLWMIANPKDFVIPVNEDGKIGLFVGFTERNVVYSIHKGEPKTFRMLGQN